MTIGNSPSIAPLIPLFCYFVENWIMYFLKLLSNLQVYFYCPLQILFSCREYFHCLLLICACLTSLMTLGIKCCCAAWFWVVTDEFLPEPSGNCGSGEAFGRSCPASPRDESTEELTGSLLLLSSMWALRIFNSNSSLPWLMETSFRVFSLDFSAAVPSLTMYLSQASMK